MKSRGKRPTTEGDDIFLTKVGVQLSDKRPTSLLQKGNEKRTTD